MKQPAPQSPKSVRVIATNRKARHLYHFIDKWEAGIVLHGTEVKSLRQGGASIVDSFADIVRGEIWLRNLYIPPYDHGNRANVETKRPRKLLLNKKEIKRIVGALAEKGQTVVPLRVYLHGQHVKIEIALVRGKKDFDKRQDIKERDTRREIDREIKHASR